MRKSVFLLGWLVVGLLQPACQAKDRVYQCEIDGNCMAGEACIERVCRKVDCRVDADCPDGEKCQDHQCLPDVPCESDDDCGSREACSHGQCQPVECRHDDQCPDRQGCLDYQCVEVTDCIADPDCPEGQVCQGGACVIGCRQDADCPAGQTCLVDQGDHGLCAECLGDADCPDGLRCIDYSCIDYCAHDGECPQGQICVHNACREGCRDDLDCPEGVCHPDSQTCIDCLQHSDCPGHLPICEANQCVPECLKDPDCPEEHICIDGNCLSGTRECDLAIQPAGPCGFGQIRIGGQKRVPVMLENRGHASCRLSEIGIAADAANQHDFGLIDPPALPLVLAPAGQAGSGAVIEVGFVPLQVGLHLATLWIDSNDPDLLIGGEDQLCNALGPPQPGQACMLLEGAGVRIDVVAVPAELDFGRVALECASVAEAVRITNLGPDLHIGSLYLEDPAGGEFTVVSQPNLPYPLAGGQTVGLGLEFLPGQPGPRTNSLIVEFQESDVPDLQVPLHGLGTDGQVISDVFELPEVVSVDILFVVDNSNTMLEEQEALAENFQALIAWALTLEVDFHVGVVSTDMEDPDHQGRLQGDIKVITPGTPDPAAVFAENVRLGTYGSWEEQGLAASHAALSLPLAATDNAGFLRDGAKLQVIYVSDEDDASPARPEFYTGYFLDLKDNIAWLGLSAICGDLPEGCPTAEPGPRYHAVVNGTRGLFQSICQPDWSTMLSQLGEHIFAPIRMFSLGQHPDPATLEVSVDGQPVPRASCEGCPDGWTYLDNLNNILFGRDVLPAYGSTVVIEYQAICL